MTATAGTDLAPIDAQFRELAPIGNIDIEKTISDARAFEEIKARILGPDDWVPIEGKLVPTAVGVNKLAGPCGHTWEIISRNEHGDPGVRRTIVEDVVYGTKTVQKRGRGGGTYEKEVADIANPVATKKVIFTVTMRATDRWGRVCVVDGSIDTVEAPNMPDNTMRQKAETRARKKASTVLVGGIDAQYAEEGKVDVRLRRLQRNASVNIRDLLRRAAALGAIPQSDKAMFLDWAREKVRGCEDLPASPSSLPLAQVQAIAKKLDEIEDGAAR
jgi:hypothetical protein